MTDVAYHLDDDTGAKLSLQFVNSNREVVNEREVDARTSVREPLLAYRSNIRELEHLDETYYALYEAKLHPKEDPTLEERMSDLGEYQEAFVTTTLDAFDHVIGEWEEDGQEVKWYKPLEIGKIASVLDSVNFNQEVSKVGGELLSNFITTHPLPNANHRVAISLLEAYLMSLDDDFEMPNTGITGEWYNWAEGFVYKSKRLMTLARKSGLLRHLHDAGVDRVVRDGDNYIRLSNHELDRSDYLDYYAGEVHRKEAIGFVTGILDRAGHPELLGQQDRSRRRFLERLSN